MMRLCSGFRYFVLLLAFLFMNASSAAPSSPLADSIEALVAGQTGTLSGVSALAGYIDTPKNKPLIFVMTINNHIQPQETIRQFEEKLCALIIESITHSTTLK
jgi:hypothetical protein